MSEKDKLKRAKLYMDKLSCGIDPNSGMRVKEDDIVRDSRVIACFEYISSVLGRQIEVSEAAEISLPDSVKKTAKAATYITDEQFSQLRLKSGQCRVSDIAAEINRVIEPNNSKKLQPAWITNWLESIGMITKDSQGRRCASAEGESIGITSHLRKSADGREYILNLYSEQAQTFIFDNLRVVIEKHYSDSVTEQRNSRVRAYITDEQLLQLSPNSEECRVSEIAAEINRVIEPNNSKRMQAAWINDWLESIGMITKDPQGRRCASAEGESIGITSHQKQSADGREYILNLYSEQAQTFIYDNLRTVIDHHYEE